MVMLRTIKLQTLKRQFFQPKNNITSEIYEIN